MREVDATRGTMESADVKQRRSLRYVAFAAVAFATVSVLACVIAVPLVYHHVQSAHSYMHAEADFCKVAHESLA